MKICELIHDNFLVDESDGKKVFQDFTRDEKQMRYLFESFVLNFYLKHRHEHGFHVNGQYPLRWHRHPLDEESAQYLPIMKPDIILDKDEKKIFH